MTRSYLGIFHQINFAVQEFDHSATYNDDQNGRPFTFATRIRKYGDVHFYTVNINSNVLILVIRNIVIFFSKSKSVTQNT